MAHGELTTAPQNDHPLTTPTAPSALDRASHSLRAILERHKFHYGPVYRPHTHVRLGDTTVELWVSPRRLPMLLVADAAIAPVAPDLKMVFGIAKMLRDYGADRAQYEANKVAPLQPGEAFVTSGAKYHFKYTILAVIFDNQKRTSPGIIRQAVRTGVQLATQRGAKTILLPDMTENLLSQPNWITEEQRRATAQSTAAMMAEAVRACRGMVKKVKIWVWEPAHVAAYEREIKRLGSEH
jgi:O-acetyl-ADP-ribose deacetylase (regulator of RNase III)